MAKNCTLSLKDGKYFKCDHCVYKTVRKHNLKRHVEKMHTESRKTLECCGRLFFTKSNLRDHLKAFHRNGYICSICARGFQRKALLTRHMMIHNDKKEFRCPLCTYETSHKSNLERHKKVHRQTRPSVVCNKKNSYKRCIVYNAFRPTYSIKNIHIAMRVAGNAGEHMLLNREYSKLHNIFNYEKHKETVVSTMDMKHELLPLQKMHQPFTSTNFLTRNQWAFDYSMENTDKTCENLVRNNQQMERASWLHNFYYTTQSNSNRYQDFSVESAETREFEDPKDILEVENNSETERKDDPVDIYNLKEGVREDYNSRSKLKQLRLCYFPYKCNFCNSRFTSQQELFLHSDACIC